MVRRGEGRGTGHQIRGGELEKASWKEVHVLIAVQSTERKLRGGGELTLVLGCVQGLNVCERIG